MTPVTLAVRLLRFGNGEVDNVLLSRADARYLAALVERDRYASYKDAQDAK